MSVIKKGFRIFPPLESIEIVGLSSISEGQSLIYKVIGTYRGKTIQTREITNGITWVGTNQQGVLSVPLNGVIGDDRTTTISVTARGMQTSKVINILDTTPNSDNEITGNIPIDIYTQTVTNSNIDSAGAWYRWLDHSNTEVPGIYDYTSALVIPKYEVFFEEGDKLDKLVWFDGSGTASGNGVTPLPFEVLWEGETEWETVHIFEGEGYKIWRETQSFNYRLIKGFRMQASEFKALWPVKIGFVGRFLERVDDPVILEGSDVMDQFGNNHLYYERDWAELNPYSSWRVYSNFMRMEYNDKQFYDNGDYITRRIRFAPDRANNWDNEVLQAQNAGRMTVMVFTNNTYANCETFPGFNPEGSNPGQNYHRANGAPMLDPASYLTQEPIITEWFKRHGSYSFTDSELTRVSDGQRYTGDDIHQRLSGLNTNVLTVYGNETNADFDGLNRWVSAEAAYIQWRVAYDGYNGLFPGVGYIYQVPNAKLGYGHSLYPNPCGLHTSYRYALNHQVRQDGTVGAFWDHDDLHHYNGYPDYSGAPIQYGDALERFLAIRKLHQKYSGGRTKIIMTEYGSSNDPQASVEIDQFGNRIAGVFYVKAKNGLTDKQRRSAFIIGQGLFHSWLGFLLSCIYSLRNQDIPKPDINWDKLCGTYLELVETHLIQMRPLLTGYKAGRMDNPYQVESNKLDRTKPFVLNLHKTGQPDIKAVWADDEVVTPVNIDLPNGGTLYTFQDTGINMQSQILPSGINVIIPSEVPQFIKIN